MTGPSGEAAIWVLADPRAGTAAQALGIAERLGQPFRTVPLEWGMAARLAWPWPTLAGLAGATRGLLAPPGPAPRWPRLVLSAGRRSVPVARWLGRRGWRLVHCMRPGFGAGAFDLLVLGRHDAAPPAGNILEVLGATHRVSPARLAGARAEWAGLAALPQPRVALLAGGPVRGEGMDPGVAAALAQQVAGFAGSVLASASRRTGGVATAAMAGVLRGTPHRLFAWGEGGPNPYLGFLAWADAVVVTGDSVSMLSEALATAGPVYVADPGGLGPRHRALAESLYAAGQALPVSAAPNPFAREPLDETGRVAAAIRARGWA